MTKRKREKEVVSREVRLNDLGLILINDIQRREVRIVDRKTPNKALEKVSYEFFKEVMSQ